MAACGELLPMPTAAIFADTQAEPDSVYQWLDWLHGQLPFAIYVVSAGNLGARELETFLSKKSGNTYRKSGIPAFIKGHGLLNRKCTSDFKVTPIVQSLRVLAAVPRGEKTVQVIQWIGISMDEAHRMKPSREPWIEHRWPLIEQRITRQKCLAWMAAKGYPKPPRSACVFCPYHNDNEWKRLKREEPKEFERAVNFERAMQAASERDTVAKGTPFLHRSCLPLDEVSFDDKEQLNLFGNECEGLCGV